MVKSMFGFMAWMVWVLIFFAGTIESKIPHSPFIKATNTAVASNHHQSNLPFNNSDPLQLPEESEVLNAAFDDESDEGKKMALTIFSELIFGFNESVETYSVQSFQNEQAVQQIIPIPLFVLHHSWKSNLA